MAGDGTSAFDLYGLPQQEQAARVNARVAALRGQSNLGAVLQASGDPGFASAGKMYSGQAENETNQLRETAGNVLAHSLQKQQQDITNAHAQKEYERQVKNDADEMSYKWAKLRDERAKEKNAPKYELKPGIGPNGEPMWVDPKDPSAAPMPVAAQAAIVGDPAKQRQMALGKVKDADARKTYDANQATLQQMTRLRENIAAHPDAFGITSDLSSFVPGTGPLSNVLKKAVGNEQTQKRIEKGNQDVFNKLSNVSQAIVRSRAGLRGESSAMVQDKINQFLPQRSDTHQGALSKADSYIDELSNNIHDFETNFNVPPLQAAEAKVAKPSAVEQRAAAYMQQ